MVHAMSDSKEYLDDPEDGHEGEPEPTSHDDHEYVILPAELHDGPRAFIGTNEDDYWRGTLGDDLAEGAGGNDSFWGDWGNDWLYGHSGDDYLSGGQGNDTLIGGEGADTLNGDEGFDIARYDDSDAGVTIDLAHGEAHGGDAEGDSLYGIEGLIGSIHDDILKGDSEDNYLYGNSGSDRLEGRGGDDTLVGGHGDDILDGGKGDDSLFGNTDNDILIGGLGADILDGGGGEDVAVYFDSTSGVLIDLVAGTGTGGEADGDTLTGIENVIGSNHDDVLIGDGGDNLLLGLGGDDYLIGGDGDDVLMGGSGGDVLAGGVGTDIASYADSITGVSVDLTAGTAANGNAAGDSLSGIENLEGSYGNDVLRGDAGVNEIWGRDGDDVVYVSGGADTLHGDDGFDWVSYIFTLTGVWVDLANGLDSGGAALDGFEGIEGSYHSDTLSGDAQENHLIGHHGNDMLEGGAGADILSGSHGNDTASYQDSSAPVVVDLGAGTGVGGDAQGDVLSGIENLIGSAHNDVLVGDAGGNNFTGGAGGDLIDGGGGTDRVIYANSDAGVAVDLESGVGSGGHADGDTLVGIENLFGSVHDDSLAGDANDNVLHGLDGVDTIEGRAGNDILSGGDGADTFIFEDGDGQDTINDFTAGTDAIDLHGYDLAALGISDFAGLEAAMSASPDVEIALAGGDSIILVGVAATDLGADDFLI